MITEKYDLLIIGAGICGLTIGKALTSSSLSFKIAEKSKAYGGRVATRRFTGQPVDHGAQYFTAQDPRFLAWVEQLEEDGIAKLWTKRFKVWNGEELLDEDLNKRRYVCPAGMTAMAKELATVLPVSRELKITSANYEGKLWRLRTDQEVEIQTERVVSTAPLPQSRELFDKYFTDSFKEELNSINYNPCICAIFIYENTQNVDWKGIFWKNGKVLSWVANDSSKRTNPSKTIIVAHCSAEFSETHFDESDEIIYEAILGELGNALPDWLLKPEEKQIKKWRYSQAASVLGRPFAKVDESLILTGDWCLESKIEGAYLAGLEVADLVK